MVLSAASRRCAASAAATARRRRPALTPTQCSSRRTYLSDSEHPLSPFSEVESSILSAALRHVPQLGFTSDALSAGAREAGYRDASASVFARGPFELVNYHLVTRRLALRQEVQFPESAGPGVGARVRSLVLHRLRANKDVVHRWQDALALMALPSNVPLSLAELARLSDEIWHLAGDASVDFSWYTKRAALSAVYSSAELYMTTDRSAEFKDTELFLDRRLEDLQGAGGALGATGQWLGFTAQSLVNVARSKGVRI